MSRPFHTRLTVLAGLAVCVLLSVPALGQTLRFDTYRDFVIPDSANIRLRNFYSDWSFSQSVGVRYMRSSGEGADYLYANDRGRVRDDGIDYPLVSSLNMKNYLLISKYMDLDISLNMTYSYYPMGTEDEQFDVNVVGEGLSARMGAFTLNMTRDGIDGGFNGRHVTAGGYTRSDSDKGFSATVSTEFDITEFVKGRVYDSPSYSVDYVDERGRIDNLRGDKYRYFRNTFGLDVDWLMAKNKNLSYAFERTDSRPLDDEYGQTESTVTKQSLIYQQQINPVLMAGARADFIWREFDEAYRGNQFQQDYLGFLGADLTENTFFQAGAGYSVASLSDPGPFEEEGDSGTAIGFASVRSKLSARLTHSIGYSRRQEGGFNAGLDVTDEYRYAIAWHNDLWSWSFMTLYDVVQPQLAMVSDYTDWINQVGVTRLLTRTVTAVANAAYSVRNNGEVQQNDMDADQVFVTNDYTTWAVNLGLTQKLTDRLTAFYYVEHLEQSGDTAKLDFNRDTVGATLTYQHDF